MNGTRNILFWIFHLPANEICLIPTIERPKARVQSKCIGGRTMTGIVEEWLPKGLRCTAASELDDAQDGYEDLARFEPKLPR